ncbi:hypothetical protein RRG08_010917 [Elysia crispata]|uniref:Uncharacterized protein n=1 Tax=Elysia crispata TaxID=231223 RepID=A0AAE1DQK5_9GAST|nr:hypothetical protein RRG08_010917 [Elysia crispata]
MVVWEPLRSLISDQNKRLCILYLSLIDSFVWTPLVSTLARGVKRSRASGMNPSFLRQNGRHVETGNAEELLLTGTLGLPVMAA